TSLLVNSTSQAVTAPVTVFNRPSPQTGAGEGASATALPFSITPAGTSMTSTAQTVAEETPAVSIDGRYVAYTATQTDHAQVFVRDTCEGTTSGCQPRTILLSSSTDGSAGNEDSRSPSMSSDG